LVQGLLQFRLASLLMAAEDFAGAADLLAELSGHLPHAEIATPEILLAHARCLWRLRQTDPTRQLLERINREYFDSEYGVLATHLLAEVEEASGEPEVAAECYRSIIRSSYADPALKTAAAYRLAAVDRN
jgi:predicted negative regulator of RcsB-dependent stress response